MWSKVGLCSFLVTFLAKQHMLKRRVNSITTVQASMSPEARDAVKFYTNLGFIPQYNETDNGLLLASEEFQELVSQDTYMWIADYEANMCLFELTNGWIWLYQDYHIDLVNDDVEVEQDHQQCYAKFPFMNGVAMETLEDCCSDLEVMKVLSGDGLPITECMYSCFPWHVDIKGFVTVEDRQSITTTSWLRDSELFYCLLGCCVAKKEMIISLS